MKALKNSRNGSQLPIQGFRFYIFAYIKNNIYFGIVNQCRAVGKTFEEILASGEQAFRMPIALLLPGGRCY